MNKKVSWEEIQKNYCGRWVELTDYTWDWSNAKPCSAVVRNSSASRNKLISGQSKDSVILYISSNQFVFGSYNKADSKSLSLY